MGAINVENLSKSFRLHHKKRNSVYDIVTLLFSKNNYEMLPVLNNISFSVQKGETLGIIGFNGSGKSTLLKLISKVYTPDNGTITINGSMIPLLELGIGFNPDFTATENIIMYGLILGFSKKDILGRIDRIFEFSELEKFRDEKIKHFSSGMYTRLAFSTAVQAEPDILLIDEVLSVGDASFQKKCFDKLEKFKKSGKTIVFVTHDMNRVVNFCDKALLLHKGNIYAHGSPDEVLKKYEEIQSGN